MMAALLSSTCDYKGFPRDQHSSSRKGNPEGRHREKNLWLCLEVTLSIFCFSLSLAEIRHIAMSKCKEAWEI